jgi:hypothetical protein
MKVRRFDSFRPERVSNPVDVSRAVEIVLGRTYSDGELERLSERIDRHATFLGELVETLNASGKLSKDDVLRLLGTDFREVDGD